MQTTRNRLQNLNKKYYRALLVRFFKSIGKGNAHSVDVFLYADYDDFPSTFIGLSFMFHV
jgi:hypothetical protein